VQDVEKMKRINGTKIIKVFFLIVFMRFVDICVIVTNIFEFPL